MKSSWIAVRAVLEAAELAKVSRAELLRAAELDAAESRDTYGWIEHTSFGLLLQKAGELTGSRTFGLHWGGTSPMIEYEFIPLLVANAATLRASLESAQRVQGILHEEPQMEFAVDGAVAKIRSTPDPQLHPVARRVLADLTMSSGMRLLDYCGRGAVRERQYSFAFHPGAEEPAYRAMFGDQVEFSCERTEISFSAAALDMANPARNVDLQSMIEQQFTRLRERMSTKLSYVDQIKLELRAARPRLLGMEQVADQLGMSARSLRRRLDEEGTTFSEVVERIQIEFAKDLLSSPHATVKAVAFELGFDSPSGFRRAFRRWTGSNPFDYRARK